MMIFCKLLLLGASYSGINENTRYNCINEMNELSFRNPR